MQEGFLKEGLSENDPEISHKRCHGSQLTVPLHLSWGQVSACALCSDTHNYFISSLHIRMQQNSNIETRSIANKLVSAQHGHN